MGCFHKWGYPNSRMVYFIEIPSINYGCFTGTSNLGHFQISPLMFDTVDSCEILHQKDVWSPTNHGIINHQLTSTGDSDFAGPSTVPSGNQTWQWENILWMELFNVFHGKSTYFYGPFSSKPCYQRVLPWPAEFSPACKVSVNVSGRMGPKLANQVKCWSVRGDFMFFFDG